MKVRAELTQNENKCGVCNTELIDDTMIGLNCPDFYRYYIGSVTLFVPEERSKAKKYKQGQAEGSQQGHRTNV